MLKFTFDYGIDYNNGHKRYGEMSVTSEKTGDVKNIRKLAKKDAEFLIVTKHQLRRNKNHRLVDFLLKKTEVVE